MKIKNWSEISLDPNSLEVLQYRVNTLKNARAVRLIKNRVQYIKDSAKDKNVLDIGVVEHFRESSSASTWLHSHVVAAAKSCLGIDILENEVNLLRKRGFNVQTHDITASPLNKKFDLIIVGDVIEHLNNPAALFTNTASMLEVGGRLLISTPNPWYANAILKNIMEGEPFTDSADHVAWFDAGTLCEMSNRNGLTLDYYCGVAADRTASVRSTIFFKMAPLFIKIGIRPEIFAKTMIYEFTRK